MSPARPQTLSVATWVYGRTQADDDPTESFHEASRLYPNVFDADLPGGSLLLRSAELRASAARAVRRRTGLACVELPAPLAIGERLDAVIARRRSTRSYGPSPISLAELATLLTASYGVTGAVEDVEQPLRAVPSGGALYPLELYVAALRVDGLDTALYHYDPLRDVVERIRPLSASDLASLTPYDELLVPSAAVTFLTAVFWRSRFKYGARSYRFSLLEAGHAAQNHLLAATALGLASCPVGGFYDRKVDNLLGIDGVYEASLYVLPVAGRA